LRKDGRQRFEFAGLGPAVLGSSFFILKYLLTEMASDCDVKGVLKFMCFSFALEDSYPNQYVIYAFRMDL